MQGSRNAIDDERRAFALPGGSHDHTLRVLSIALPFAIDLESGPAKVTALSGDYDYAENTLQIPGQAVFVAPDDLKLTSSRTAIDLRAQRVVASGPVAGKTAIGTFSADAMELDLEGRTMALIGRARLRMISREKDNGP